MHPNSGDRRRRRRAGTIAWGCARGRAPAAHPPVAGGGANNEVVEMGESRTPRPEPSAEDRLRACPMICRHPVEPASAPSPQDQSRPLSGFVLDYATLIRDASPLDDASTARGEGAASTLTLLPKQRRREQAGGCQLLRFAACLTRPDGTSARVPRGSGPVETTHPHDHPVYQSNARSGSCRYSGSGSV